MARCALALLFASKDGHEERKSIFLEKFPRQHQSQQLLRQLPPPESRRRRVEREPRDKLCNGVFFAVQIVRFVFFFFLYISLRFFVSVYFSVLVLNAAIS